ncbi:DUF6892 domain-containing protein [Formosa algae]|uniref:Knr4/Smi1-like domain-containing protein n=1 Tax=Formosa algae TaxID=225843 RepID=A0A9X0YNN2_9FLAO|nr:hypothetical protein [Formosa algae]MBP1840552.1 hypothetical protein [Formosa algae]MDQ0336035.1 hypothetical protein [Formosa algae]OEI81080.1 hypothetical protein AST99_05300 [Formosa algae]
MITIDLSSTGLKINTTVIQFPVSIDTLKQAFGEACRISKGKHNTVFTWDDSGVLAYSRGGELIESLSVVLALQTYDFSPKQTFTGIFNYNYRDIVTYYKTHVDEHIKLFDGDNTGALVQGNYSAWFDADKDTIKTIEISTYTPFVRWAGIPEDKYTIKPIEEDEITFVDFGFKLSIIEELMYMKGLMKPQFDIHEFAKWYRGREIDLDEEGYEPIAEVEQYFKALPVPKRLASEITEIYQDGGNDIYMNLSPFSGGAVEYWDIKTCVDAKHFPNLKKVTLCYATDAAYDEFIALGIDADWL